MLVYSVHNTNSYPEKEVYSMNCFNCGNPLTPEAKFCANCGAKQVSAPKFCMQCGAMLGANAQFCSNCGTSVQQSTADALRNNVESSESSPADALDKTEGVVEQFQSEPTAQPMAGETQVLNENPIAPPPVYAQPQTPVYAPPVQNVVPPVVQPMVNPGVAAGVVTAAGAAAKGAAKTVSTAKKIAVFAAVVAFLLGAVTACLHFFVDAPEDTVHTLIESVSEMDYDKMLSCMDSKTEKMIRASMGIAGDLMGSLTGVSLDLEDLMALAPAMAPYFETPDLNIRDAETILYADCSLQKLMQYCADANSEDDIPSGYLSDNEIINFLMKYKIKLPGLENLIAKTAIVKITLDNGEVGYLPLINEGWGDWRIPVSELSALLEGTN